MNVRRKTDQAAEWGQTPYGFGGRGDVSGRDVMHALTAGGNMTDARGVRLSRGPQIGQDAVD